MRISLASIDNLSEVMEIFDEARKTIALLGIDQWQNGYPNEHIIREDTKNERLFVVEDDEICGTFAVILDGEPTYDKIYNGEWLTGNDYADYMAIHRVAVAVTSRGKGVSTEIIDFATKLAKENSRGSLRIDTHEGNTVMRKMLEKHGFVYCGIIYLEDGERRVAYEKLI
ncbi:MAG: GNAT family N-acetyltransferase [Ruminococcaceae bacterium]|nr:GNAT family N-acetyltransferase [Oscillospiraceae bacterium]